MSIQQPTYPITTADLVTYVGTYVDESVTSGPPGPAGPAGAVNSITSPDGSVTIGGTPANPTLEVTASKFVTPGEAEVVTAASGAATYIIPAPSTSTMDLITLTANCSLAFPTAAAGESFLLALVQDATGSRTVTWPAAVKWAGGTAPTLTTTPGKTDVFSFVCLDGTHWLGFVPGQNF